MTISEKVWGCKWTRLRRKQWIREVRATCAGVRLSPCLLALGFKHNAPRPENHGKCQEAWNIITQVKDRNWSSLVQHFGGGLCAVDTNRGMRNDRTFMNHTELAPYIVPDTSSNYVAGHYGFGHVFVRFVWNCKQLENRETIQISNSLRGGFQIKVKNITSRSMGVGYWVGKLNLDKCQCAMRKTDGK